MSDRPLRLAFLADPDSVHTRRWMDEYLARGHEIHLLVPRNEAAGVNVDRRITVHPFNAWPPIPIRGSGSLLTSLALRRLLRRLQPDVLHAHSLNRYGIAGWLSAFHPFVITVWGSDILRVVQRTRVDRLRARCALRSADLVTGGSRDLTRAAIAGGASAERTRYVHLGVNTDAFSPGPDPTDLRAKLRLQGRRVVLSNRSIAPLYRQPVVVEALAMLPPDVVVVMTRQNVVPEELMAVESRATELGVADRVRILDRVPDADLPRLYRLAAVVVSIPASDGGPSTIAEALAVGRPVVATDVPSVREWLGELDDASLVPVDDAVATAQALNRQLDLTPAARQRLADLGRSAVLDRADVQANSDEMERLYRSLARQHRRRRAVSRDRGR